MKILVVRGDQLRPVNSLLLNCIMYHEDVQGLVQDRCVRGGVIKLCE